MKSIKNISLLSRVRKVNKKSKLVNSGALLLAALMGSQVASAACTIDIVDDWGSGYRADLTVTNTGAAVSSWTVNWQMPADTTFNSGWNGDFNCSAASCTFSPASWGQNLGTNQSFSTGFMVATSPSASRSYTINGALCGVTPPTPTPTPVPPTPTPTPVPPTPTPTPVPPTPTPTPSTDVAWNLDGGSSSIYYVSTKKEHTVENNTFLADAGEPDALEGTITTSGDAILSIDLNEVDSNNATRDGRLLSLLFETDLLPKAFMRVGIDINAVNAMAVGETAIQTITGDLSLHAVRQRVSADVLVVKKSASEVTVSTIKPIIISSKSFDLASGIEALRSVANLTSVGETVPVYFNLNYTANTNPSTTPVDMPTAPATPTALTGTYNATANQADLAWTDNANNETMFLVRRKSATAEWATTAELLPNTASLSEGLPNTDAHSYKVIAINGGVPSLASNVVEVSSVIVDPIEAGRTAYGTQCAGCHGDNAQGSSNFPPLDTPRDIAGMISYIETNMPVGNPAECDAQCASDIAAFLQTLWVDPLACDTSIAPVSYGARQLKILTRDEYQNSVNDLLGVNFDVTSGLSADAKVGFFANNTHAPVHSTSYSNYLLVAEEIAQWSSAQSFSPALSCGSFNQSCADQFVNTLAPKIFRRPLTAAEVTEYEAMANGTHTNGDVQAGIEMAIEAALSSPQFLYRSELGEANPSNNAIASDAFELTSHEMATFLAYTFTGSTPDAELLQAAANDQLRSEAEIATQAQRLAGNATDRLGDFVGGWLGTSDLAAAAKDSVEYPNFDALVPHMQAELTETFAHIMLDPAEQFASFYNANYTFLNETLANHYGISGVSGNNMRQVTTSDRGGILTNGAFMSRWGEQVETSPILRSVRVRRRMLCQDQPAPPAGTFADREAKLAELSEFIQDPTTTNRMKVHRLTEDVPCTNCHIEYINPLGFGMEDFDTVGRVRTTDLNGNLIDAVGALFAPNDYYNLNDPSVPFEGSRGLGEVLAASTTAQACLPQQMFRFITGVGHDSIDPSIPGGPQLAETEKVGYMCELEDLANEMAVSPRSMFESFATMEAVRYRKAWSRN